MESLILAVVLLFLFVESLLEDFHVLTNMLLVTLGQHKSSRPFHIILLLNIYLLNLMAANEYK